MSEAATTFKRRLQRVLTDGAAMPSLHHGSHHHQNSLAEIRLRHARERYDTPTLYPLYGIVYTLARRESILFPILANLSKFILMSAVVGSLTICFMTPLSSKILKIASFGLLPKFIRIGPAIGFSVILAAIFILPFLAHFKHQIDRLVCEEVGAHECVELPRKTLEQKPEAWFELGIWLFSLPINFIPLIGIPLFIYMNGLVKAYSFAKTRVALESPEWDYNKRCRFVFHQVWRLQCAGSLAVCLEMIPMVGPAFQMTTLVARALYVADGKNLDVAKATTIGNRRPC